MCHLDRHICKSEVDLIYRMLVDWKVYSSSIYEKALELIQIPELVDGEYEIVSPNYIGFGFNRRFELLKSKVLRYIVKNGVVLTAYADLSQADNTGIKFDMQTNESMLLELSERNEDTFCHIKSNLWNIYIELLAKLNYEIRFIHNTKNPQIRIFKEDKVIKINKDLELTILKHQNTYHSTQSSVDTKLNTVEDILEVLQVI